MTINFHWTASARAIFADFRHTFGLRFTLGLAVLALCVGFPTSQALPSSDIPPNSKSFPIRGGSQPFAITMGPDGNFWFTLSNSNEVARISPLGKFTYFRTPTLSNPAFITPGPDGNIWFGEGSTGKIASITLKGSTRTAAITEIQFSFFGVSVGITTGSDGNIWFTDQTDHAVWRYNPSTRVFAEFRTPTPNSFPGDITTGADGNMWFTEQAVDKFGRITPSGVITEFSGVNSPSSIAAGPDGNIWISSAFVSEVARVTPTVEITIFQTPSPPTIIRPGNSNNLLFTEFSANKIASITTDGVVTESAEFFRSGPTGLTAGVGSRVWFLGASTNLVYETVVPQ
jgi:virginiamycin B lyase